MTHLLTCATYNYLPMLELLLASHQHTNSHVPLHVHAIDWPEEAIEQVSHQYPNSLWHATALPDTAEAHEMKGPVPRRAGILKLKVKLIHDTYNRTDQTVLWVDADTLLLSSIEPLVSRVCRHGDFGVTYRPRKRDHAKFAVAVLCFKKNEIVKGLIKRYRDDVERSTGLVKRADDNGVPWFHDQLGLWYAYRSLSRNSLGLPRRSGPKLVALTDAEHSLDGNRQGIFSSRRDQIFDVDDMRAELQSRGIIPGSGWSNTAASDT